MWRGRRKWRKGAERSKIRETHRACTAQVATALTVRRADPLFELMLMGRPRRLIA